jgi:hypothetical protein
VQQDRVPSVLLQGVADGAVLSAVHIIMECGLSCCWMQCAVIGLLVAVQDEAALQSGVQHQSVLLSAVHRLFGFWPKASVVSVVPLQ